MNYITKNYTGREIKTEIAKISNAHLISAAPDMLQALKALLRESLDDNGATLRPSREAIATAQAALRKAVGLR